MSDLIKDNLLDNYSDFVVLRDLIKWCCKLYPSYYCNRRLGGVEQAEYNQLLRTLSAANKLLAKMMRDVDDGK